MYIDVSTKYSKYIKYYMEVSTASDLLTNPTKTFADKISQIPTEELKSLVASLTNVGDVAGANRYKAMLVSRKYTVKELPVQQQVSKAKAFHVLRAAGGRLERVVQQCDIIESNLA